MIRMRYFPGLILVAALGVGGRAAIAATAAPAPISLTASDGTGLQIVSFKANAVVEDPLAFTELHLIFKNPDARVLEGQFEITLPPSAAVSRFAMKQIVGLARGRSRRAAGGARSVRGLPAPPAGSGAAGEGRGQSVPRARLSHRRVERKGDHHLLFAGAAERGRSLPALLEGAADARASRDPRAHRQARRRSGGDFARRLDGGATIDRGHQVPLPAGPRSHRAVAAAGRRQSARHPARQPGGRAHRAGHRRGARSDRLGWRCSSTPALRERSASPTRCAWSESSWRSSPARLRRLQLRVLAFDVDTESIFEGAARRLRRPCSCSACRRAARSVAPTWRAP